MNRLCSKQKYSTHYECPLVAGDCLLAQSTGGPLTRKLPLKPAEIAGLLETARSGRPENINYSPLTAQTDPLVVLL